MCPYPFGLKAQKIYRDEMINVKYLFFIKLSRQPETQFILISYLTTLLQWQLSNSPSIDWHSLFSTQNIANVLRVYRRRPASKMSSETQFSHYYKERATHDREQRQSDRRHELLAKQKRHRNSLNDAQRDIKPLEKQTLSPEQKRRNELFRNKLQLSEWWMEKPDDIANWYIRPCPKGMRCLVVAANGRTEVYNKKGRFLNRFRSRLPGDTRHRQSTTMLDCIFVFSLSEYFVLDVLAYGNQDVTECEASFRFYWVQSRLQEDNLDVVSEQNQHAFRIIDNCECGDDIALNSFVARYPLWQSNTPELDGFLFYHKESAYVSGTTPLVLWLFAFMLPEVLNVPELNENYLLQKPDNYTNCLTFIDEFNRKMKQRRPSRRDKMDICDEEHVDIDQRNLELESMDNSGFDEMSGDLGAEEMLNDEVELNKKSASDCEP